MEIKIQSTTKNKNGFTLLELIVVIAIIGVLAGVILLATQNARVSARDAKRIGDMRQLSTALQQYFIAHNTFPTGTGSVSASGARVDDPTAFDSVQEPMIPNYIPLFPVAPTPADGSCNGTGRGFNNYWYDSSPDGTYYTLTFCIGKQSGTLQPGIRMFTQDTFR